MSYRNLLNLYETIDKLQKGNASKEAIDHIIFMEIGSPKLPDGCFLCGGKFHWNGITEGVYWHGFNGTEIWLCLPCVPRFSMHLMHDIYPLRHTIWGRPGR